MRIHRVGISLFAISIAVLVVFAPARRTHAAGFVPENSGTANTLYDVQFYGATGYAIGPNGTILKTTDNGATWVSKSTGGATLYALDLVDASNLWVVGSNVRYQSVDGGDHWSVLAGGGVFRGVEFKGATVGYVAGSTTFGTGQVMTTTDSGTIWTPHVAGSAGLPAASVFNHVHCFNFMTCWVVGSGGTVAKTVNGGASWTAQSSGTTAGIEDVIFTDDKIGFLVGGSDLRYTSNGGTTWSNPISGGGTLSSPMHALDFIDKNNGWAVGNAGIVLRTSDGGAHWTTVTTGLPSATLNGAKFQIELGDSTGTFVEGWAVGTSGTILRFDEISPTAPTGLARTSAGTTDTTPSFTWSAATDNVGVKGYRVEIQNSSEVTVVSGTDIGNVLTYTVPDVSALAVGAYTFYVSAQDGAGNSSAFATIGFTITAPPPPPAGDTTVPTGTLIINSNASRTNNASVTLTLTCSDNVACTQMRFSNDSGVTWSAWETFVATKVWGLIAGDGNKTVYGQFRDAAANASTALIIDSIVLDTIAPSVTGLSVPSTITRGSAQDISASFSDGDGVQACSLLINGASTASMNMTPAKNGMANIAYAFSSVGTYTMQVRCSDAAGNNGTSASVTRTVSEPVAGTDSTQPTAPGNLMRTSADTDTTPTFTWSAATDASGIASYEAAIDSSNAYQGIDNVLTWTVSDGSPLAAGAHTVLVRAIDASSNRNVGPASQVAFTIVASSSGNDGGTTGGGTTTTGGGNGGTTSGGNGGTTSGGGTTTGGGSGTTTTGGSGGIVTPGPNGGGGGGTSTVVAGVSGPPFTLEQMQEDARVIAQGDIALLLGNVGLQNAMQCQMDPVAASLKVEKVFGAISDSTVHSAIIDFTACGTRTTLHLGSGERLGVVNSYKSAFGRLPSTAAHWFDVIKIANGRFPGETSATAEAAAKVRFKKIYVRAANMSAQHDSAAVNVMAYGLRPLPRKVASESAAIKIYKKIFGTTPLTAPQWDALRAIAYSGAVR